MKKLFGFLTQGWFLSLVGTTALAVLVWFAGPLFGFAGTEPLAEESARWILILCLYAAWALFVIGSVIRARLRNRRMVEQLAAAPQPAPDPTEEATSEELETLRSRFDDALEVLKKTATKRRLGGRYLYELPWYLIIGPPGCGKTTALINSGLDFPLAERFGQDAIRGVGGTRNCDWWFTDKAVLLDTAGRYTTQDSYEAVDSSAWQGFLDLLKKHRPRRPINGVLVAISVSDLLEQTETERALQARAIKQRIQELHERLGVRFPVYVLFMKSDLVAGFMEFFNDLGKEQRAQVWGMTFPLDDGGDEEPAIAGFTRELELLEGRVREHMTARIHQERNPEKRNLIFAFPQQFALLKPVADRFLNDVFQPNRFEERAFLRGVYFTSGTQTGAPIDRVLSSLAANFGLDRQGSGAFSGSARSFFIERLLGDVIFPESGLAGTNPRLERRRRWLQRGAYAGALGIALLAAAAWLTSYTKNRSYVNDVRQQVAAINTQIEQLPRGNRDVVEILPLLNDVRNISGGYASRDDDIPVAMGLGLYQGKKLGPQTQDAYRRVLSKTLLPRVILRIEEQMRQYADDPEYLYEALRIYLMLDNPEHYDGESVETWVALDWEQNLHRSVTTEQREQLKTHLNALFENRPTKLPIALDPGLIEQARDIINRRSLADRIYQQLKRNGLDQDLSDFTVNEAAGDYATFVFERTSGKPLNQGVPALYTYDGYHSGFERQVGDLISGLVKETWILGPESQVSSGAEQSERLLGDVRDLYLRDYVEQWETLLADLEIVAFRSLGQSVEMLRILSDKELSPLRQLLEAAAYQTQLEKSDDSNAAQEQLGKHGKRLLGKVTGRFKRFFKEVDLPKADEATAPPESYVSRRFAQLHAYVQGKDDKPPPIDKLLGDLNRLFFFMKAVMAAADSGKGDTFVEGVEITEVKSIADELPPPVNDWIRTVGQDSGNLIAGGARAHINNIWTAEILPFCREAIHDRYPIKRGSSRETTIHDFGRLFGPGGLIDAFFQENLTKFVDTTNEQWSWRGEGLGISDEALAQFQRAANIRDAFFVGGGKTPSATFELKPLTMGQDIKQFILDLEGQIVDYRHGPPQISKLQWPGPDGPGRVRLVFVHKYGSRPSINEEGPWAWFRVLDRSRIASSNQPEMFRVTFSVSDTIADMSASFELRATSVRNPFNLDQLRRFSCPARL